MKDTHESVGGSNLAVGGLIFSRLFTKESIHPYDEVEWELRTAEITGEDGKVVFRQDEVEFPRSWSQLATNIVASKYFRGKLDSSEREWSLKQLIDRVVKTIVKWGRDGKYFASNEDQKTFEYELTYLLLHQMMAFNSPVWFNIGVPNVHQQSSACFLLDVEDNMESILNWYVEEGLVFRSGSGAGVNLSKIRSSREQLSGGGAASGPLSFAKAADASSGVIKSGGKTRRAAKLISLNADHPDIEDFIWCKVKEEKKARVLIEAGYSNAIDGEAYSTVSYQNANNSVGCTDEFMRAVANNEDWDLKYVTTGEVYKTIKAQDLFRQIAQAAWECADPGLIFLTTINNWHTLPKVGPIASPNPCLRKGTRLLTNDGYVAVENLTERESVSLFDGVAFSRGRVWKTGEKNLIRIYLEDCDYILDCTPDHKIYTNKGWKEAKDTEGQLVGFSEGPEPIYFRKVKKVEFLNEVDEVYDFSAPTTSMGIANGFLVHNCGEYLSIANSACNLASLNLVKFLNNNNIFDVERFKHAVDLTITAQDILVSGSDYPTPKITENARKYRQLGLGYSNLGALIMSMGLPYDSNEGRELAASITALMTGEAYHQSAKIAAFHGPFADFDENSSAMMYVIGKHSEKAADLPYNEISAAARESWHEALILGETNGYRNSQVTVLAPCGTISFFMDCSTTGIEPAIALVSYKKLVGGGMMKMTSECIERALYSLGYNMREKDKIIDYINFSDTIEGSMALKDIHLPIFDCAFKPTNGQRSIAPMGHVDMLAAIQPFLSGASSKTVNLPNSATVEDIMEIYLNAWRKGIKDISVYRDGSKANQPLSAGKSTNEIPQTSTNQAPTRRRLPTDRQAICHKFEIAGHEGYIHVGFYDDGTPGEVFIKMAKEGSTVSGLMDTIATLTSLSLQYGVPVETLVNKFRHVRFEPSGFTGNQDIPYAKSLTDYLFAFLGNIDSKLRKISQLNIGQADYLPETTGLASQSDSPTCSSCGSIMTRRSGSCYVCDNCASTSGCS